MTTIKDIARAANVSATTVSNVLNSKSNTSAETRERVLQLCETMNYYPNIMARNLKAGKSNTVMFMFSDFERSFYLKIINGINDCLTEKRIGLIICTYNATENFLHNGFADGVIVLDKKVKDSQVLAAASENMHVVLMDRLLPSSHSINSVVTDNEASMGELTEKLVEKGYVKFHFLGGPEHTLDHIERYAAFRQVLHKHQIPFSDAHYFQGDYSIQSGMRAGNIMAMGGNLPDIVVCANDNMAVGVMQSFAELGIEVPGQVAVSGFDGDPMAELPEGYLTTVDIPRYEMGYLAAETLVNAMQQQSQPVVRKIKAPIIWGKSTR